MGRQWILLIKHKALDFKMPNKIIISTNDRFGKLVILNEIFIAGNERSFECKCDCGNTVEVSLKSLRNSGTKSCGCLQKAHASNVNRKHGLYKTRLHGIWKNMRQRCYNPKASKYDSYGGKGVIICEEWKNNFEPFYSWSLSNGYADDLTIDRKEVSGNYEPDNCRWITRKAQNYNTTRSRIIFYRGKSQTITEWAVELGMETKTLSDRLKKLSVDAAFTNPVKKRTR